MKNKKLLIILAIIVFVLLLIAAMLAFLLMTQKPNTTGTAPTPTPTPSSLSVTDTVTPAVTLADTAVVSGTPTAPSGWDPIVNTKYNYTMYRPHGWFFRIFTGQDLIGINPSAIADNSDQPVAIEAYVLSNPSTDVPGIKSALNPGYTDTMRVINGRNWEMISGLLSGGGAFDDQYLKYGIFTEGSHTFAVKLSAATADYAGHADEFETVITTLWFN